MLSQISVLFLSFFFFKVTHLINCCFISLTPITYIYLSLLALALKLNVAWIHRGKNPAVCNQKWKFKIILTSTEFYINLKRGSIHIKQQNLKCAFCIFVSFFLSVSRYCSFTLSIYPSILSIYVSINLRAIPFRFFLKTLQILLLFTNLRIRYFPFSLFFISWSALNTFWYKSIP